jgi:predicted RNA-binding protein Jag
MNKTEPLLNGTVISYEVENKFMEDILKNNFGNEILSYLRTKLNNWSVTLHITVSETNNSIVTNVTNKDIFMQLAQKNINLNTLLNTFNLSVEL